MNIKTDEVSKTSQNKYATFLTFVYPTGVHHPSLLALYFHFQYISRFCVLRMNLFVAVGTNEQIFRKMFKCPRSRFGPDIATPEAEIQVEVFWFVTVCEVVE